VLNDEMLALSRAGIPLEKGIIELGRDLPGRLGAIATEIGRRMQAGESLPDILSRGTGQFPAVYCAVVAAGVRSGRLSVALEGMATTARRVSELRRDIGLSMLYPLLVLTTACILFTVVVANTAEEMSHAYAVQRVGTGWEVVWLGRLIAASSTWVWCVPLLAVALAAWWWFRSGRALASRPNRVSRRTRRRVRRLPWVGPMLQSAQAATFCDVLGLLVGQRVSLTEALVLAADASGDARLRDDALQLAEQIERGENRSLRQIHAVEIPPLVTWLVLSSVPGADLPSVLHRLARTYYRRAQYLSERNRVYVPFLLTFGVGGSATAVYALSVMVPWYALLESLGASF
jgi:general secretion pathway protein F